MLSSLVVFFALVGFVYGFCAFSAESFLFLFFSPLLHVFAVVFSVDVFLPFFFVEFS